MNTDVLKALLTKHTGESLVTATPIVEKGEVNKVYLLQTVGSSYVIRISSETDLHRFVKEAWCMKQAEILGIPGPTVLGFGTLEGGTYLLRTYVPGENGADLSHDTLPVWHTLGRYARAIHGIQVSGFGEQMTEDGIFEGSWSNYLQENLQAVERSGRLVTQGILTLAHAEQLTELFVTLRREHFTFGLIHQDLSLKNTLVRADGKVTLLDWGSAQVHIVPYMELEEILSEGVEATSPAFEAFLEGYDLSLEAFEKLKPEIWALRLLLRTDKLRLALDRCPERVEPYTKKLQAALEERDSV